jgi:hypothetical protein
MLSRFSFVAFLIVALAFPGRSEWVSLKGDGSSAAAPTVTLVSDDITESVVRIDVPGFEVQRILAKGTAYSGISLLNDVVTTESGSPEVPYVSTNLALPDRGGVTVEVVAMGDVVTFSGYRLPPARPSWREGAPEPEYIENPAAYASAAITPSVRVSVEDPVVFRDFRMTRVAIYPVQYKPETQQLSVVTSMTVRVRYNQGAGVNPKTRITRAIPRSFGQVYRHTMLNYSSVLDREFGGLETGREVLLCILPDTFATSFAPYAAWKHKTGTFVKVVKFSQMNANSTNPTIIRDSIASWYHHWADPPTYVLLGGDYPQFPRIVVTPDAGTFANEEYFAEIDGNDVFPEVLVGRFTHDLSSPAGYKLDIMVNKLIKYERTPYRTNTDWFKHAVVCANNAYATQPDTKRWVSTIMRDSAGFSVDTLLNLYGGPCIHNVSEIQTAITAGRSFLNYRGEGASAGWVYATCYPFNTSDLSSINNGEMLTYVTSIGCGVAMYDASGGNCFGEEWMEMGTTTASRGACAFNGPTWGYTHTKYNNAIDKGLYVALFQEGVECPAPALLRGKIRMYNLYGVADPYVTWHFRAYTTLGDPSIHPWRDVPKPVTMTYDNHISLGYNQVHVTVLDSVTHVPVKGAEICIAGDTAYVTGTTDASGSAIIPITVNSIDTLSILARGMKVVPREGTITAFADAEHVAPLGDPVVTDIDGNSDGKVNPNEHIRIAYVLKNWGLQASSSVTATLSAPDTTYATIVNPGPVTYGTLLASESRSATGTPLQFYVRTTAPIGSSIPVQLNVTSASHSWQYVTSVSVNGCTLEYVSLAVNDETSPHSNGRLDPGETAIVYCTVTNTGQDAAPNVSGILRSASPYIRVIDSTGTFGTIPIGGNAMNTVNYFIVAAADTCPIASTQALSLVLNTQGGGYPYSATRAASITVGLPSGTDPSGPDTYGYYIYSSDDTLYNQAPHFNWVEIRSVGTRVPWASSGDFTAAVPLPFTYKYYGRNFSSIRISSDGWIAPGSVVLTSYSNYPLPNVDNIANMIGVFWDDLFEGSSNSTSKLLYYNDVANHRFIAEWDSVGHYSGTTLRESFEVILLDPAYYPTPTGDAQFILQYRVVGEEGNCTVGNEDSTQTMGQTYLYNSTYAATATDIRAGQAIKLTTEPPSMNSTSATVSVVIGSGWNLVSNPVQRPDSLNGARRLFPHATTDYGFAFDRTLGYLQTATFQNGPGYWLRFPGGELNSITGTRILGDSIPVTVGWNIIGSITSPVDTSTIVTLPAGIRASNYFAYAAGYSPTATIEPGQGCWVKANAAGSFVLAPLREKQIPGTPIVANETDALNSLTIRDSRGGAQTLYFGTDPKNSIHLPMYALPPQPPTGAFDARFESTEGGTMVKTHDAAIRDRVEFPIAIQTSAYPITVEWTIVNGGSYELADGSGNPKMSTRVLTGKGTADVAGSAIQRMVLRVTGSTGIPGEFALNQNYPNPFNPTTAIRYQLPVDSKVTLKIFNVLGQEVSTLVDGLEKAGYKSVQWDARTGRGATAASGVYFARLDAKGANGESFSQVRKLILMK